MLLTILRISASDVLKAFSKIVVTIKYQTLDIEFLVI